MGSLIDLAQENARLAIGLLEADSPPSPPISEATADVLRQVRLSQLRRAEWLIEQVAERDRVIQPRYDGIAWLRNELPIAQTDSTRPLRHPIQWLRRHSAYRRLRFLVMRALARGASSTEATDPVKLYE